MDLSLFGSQWNWIRFPHRFRALAATILRRNGRNSFRDKVYKKTEKVKVQGDPVILNLTYPIVIIIQFVKMPFGHCLHWHLRWITALLLHHSNEKVNQMRFKLGFFLVRTFNPRFVDWHAGPTNDTRSDITVGLRSLHWSPGNACSSFTFHAPAKMFLLKQIISNT